MVPAPPKTRRRREAKPIEPMPWTIGDMFDVFDAHSNGRVITAPFDDRLAPALSAAIRAAAKSGVTLADVETAAKWLGSGGNGFMRDGVGQRYLAGVGNLVELVGKAIARGAA